MSHASSLRRQRASGAGGSVDGPRRMEDGKEAGRCTSAPNPEIHAKLLYFPKWLILLEPHPTGWEAISMISVSLHFKPGRGSQELTHSRLSKSLWR